MKVSYFQTLGERVFILSKEKYFFVMFIFLFVFSQTVNADFFHPFDKEQDNLEDINNNLPNNNLFNNGRNPVSENNSEIQEDADKNSSDSDYVSVSAEGNSGDVAAAVPSDAAAYYSPFINQGMSIAPFIGASIFSEPFSIGFQAGAEFINTAFVNFLFFGAGLNFEMGFPQENFPYSYKSNGKPMDAPALISGCVYFPAGVFYSPFKNRKFLMEMSGRLGVKIIEVASLTTTAKSDLHFAFYTALCLGAEFCNFNLKLAVGYDTIEKFNPALTVSYRFKFKKTAKQTKIAENQDKTAGGNAEKSEETNGESNL